MFKETNKICKVCKKPFIGKGATSCCSTKCSDIWTLIRKNHLDIDKIDEYDIKYCSICGKPSLNLGQHIKCHNISPTDYKQQYNVSDESLISKYLSNKYSDIQNTLIKNGYRNNFYTDNPAKNHNGLYSPLSKKYIKYENLSDDESNNQIQTIKNKIRDSKKKKKQQEYYSILGIPEMEIQEYINMPLEIGGYSRISQVLFRAIHQHKKIRKLDGIYYGIWGNKPNNEFELTLTDGSTIRIGFYIKSLNKGIIFNDNVDNYPDSLFDDLDIDVLKITEYEYFKNPTKTFNKCIKWLLNDKR